MVGDRVLLADDKVAGLAKVFDQVQRFGLGDFVAKVRDQETKELFLVFRAGG